VINLRGPQTETRRLDTGAPVGGLSRCQPARVSGNVTAKFMLFLVFQVGADRHAIEVARVIEVLAMVELRKIVGAPVGTAGEFVYRGEPVPVLDLCVLALGRPSNLRLSTRIILLRHEPQPGVMKPLGLIAEHATELAQKNLGEFATVGDALVAPDPRGRLRLLQLDKLLTPELRDLLAVYYFTQTLEAEPAA
jgi:chemotaxis-related protein WspB